MNRDELNRDGLCLASVRELLMLTGDDPDREGLLETPDRVVRSFKELYAGYNIEPKSVIKAFDPEDVDLGEGTKFDEIVLVKNIELYSQCEHHMLPFFGRCHIAYMPTKKVLGVSKLVRLMEVFARRLQIQERIGKQITNALMEFSDCSGAACVIEAKHLCMTARGVQKQHSEMVTSSMQGCFLDNATTRQELMMLNKG
jgi:GTP cyclohydrolase I